MLRARVLAPLSLVAVLASACTRSEPDILLISVDTLRRDHLSVYGYERDTTPRLRELADAGATFELAYAPTASTAPSHATLFTGLYPVAHGVVKNGIPLAEEFETLAESLAERGYQTGGIVSSFVLKARFGFERGFTSYQDEFEPDTTSIFRESWGEFEVGGAFDRRAEYTTDLAIRWLREQREPERPFFLFVHYMDPHSPYLAPGEHALHYVEAEADLDPQEQQRRLYDAEIAYTDAEIGRLLDALEETGLAGNTLVVVTADHGEGLWDHGYQTHGVHLYEEEVRIPLLIRWPGRIIAGLRFPEPVELVDLKPTLLDLAEPPPRRPRAPAHGRSLAGALRADEPLEAERPVFFHRRHYRHGTVEGITVSGERFGLRWGRWKYIGPTHAEKPELYDLERDPGEHDNLAPAEPQIGAELADRLEAWRNAYGPSVRAPVPRIPAGDQRALEALGYAE